VQRLGGFIAAAALGSWALAVVSAAAITIGAPLASAADGSGCSGYNVGGNSWAVQCNKGGGSSTSGSGVTNGCAYYTLTEAESLYLVSPVVVAGYQAPSGYIWLLQDCPDQYFGDPSILLFADGGTLTTEDLAAQAYAELSPPTLSVGTAPPSGRDGLVGLPEWFWIDAADYQTLLQTVSLGGLSATVTARPGPLVINPGDGQASFSCAAPGTPYNPSEPAGSQQSDCTFLYTRPSAGLPGNQFNVSISVTWTATWAGTGGTGGTLAPITRTTEIALQIAQAEAVYSGEQA
jgi:hypothetical protein